jgi:HD superfamily phosphohydrolase YqeK
MKNIKLFERELNLIVDEELRMITKAYLDEKVPPYFWEIGASSSGKYHPKFSQNDGGLVRHTKAVVMFAEELLRMNTYAYMRAEYKDYVIVACIIHDTCKYGKAEYNKAEYSAHARNAAELFKEFCIHECDYIPSEYLLNAVIAHMGQWTEDKDERPFTSVDRCVHMADYMASRNFIDIPSITEEYNSVVNGTDEDVPF